MAAQKKAQNGESFCPAPPPASRARAFLGLLLCSWEESIEEEEEEKEGVVLLRSWRCQGLREISQHGLCEGEYPTEGMDM